MQETETHNGAKGHLRMHAKVRLKTMVARSSQEQTVFARTERWRNSEMILSFPLHQKGADKLCDTVCTHRWFLQFYLRVWNNQL